MTAIRIFVASLGAFLLGVAFLGGLGLMGRNVRALWGNTGLPGGLWLLGIRLGGTAVCVKPELAGRTAIPGK